jgi:uncharacterized lipoprotein
VILRSFCILAAGSLAIVAAAGCEPNRQSNVAGSPATKPVSASAIPMAVPSATSSDAANDTFAMPNEVGKVLQTAQDDIQRVSGNLIFITHSTDATGQSRLQIFDRDWKVCKQNIASGKRVSQDADINFSVVKIEESCP